MSTDIIDRLAALTAHHILFPDPEKTAFVVDPVLERAVQAIALSR